MITAQDKILHVASKLGLTSLKDMQASTGAVYDVDTEFNGVIFGNASQHVNPALTNLNDNRFEVNEALLIENISFFSRNDAVGNFRNFQTSYGSSAVIVFDLVIGNKTVMKDTPVFAAGMPFTFASHGTTDTIIVADPESIILPRHQVFMEGAGILIPPQVDFSINYRIFDVVTGAQLPIVAAIKIGAYLFGTKVLLNFNTSI
jgi:hypothetical protein